MAVGFNPNAQPAAVLGRGRFNKNTDAEWPPAAAERARRDDDDDDGPPRLKNAHAAAVGNAIRGLRGVPQAAEHVQGLEALLDGAEDDVEKSLRELGGPGTRATIEKTDGPLRAHIKKLEDRLGASHLQKFEGSSAYGDPHARAQIEQIRKQELGLGR